MLLPTLAAVAQHGNHDPFGANLVPPEKIAQYRDAIDLDSQQLARIREHVESIHESMPQLQERIKQANHNMWELLNGDKVDEAAAVKQLEEFFDAEQAMKKLHLQIMIRVRNELTAEQVKKLKEIIAEEQPLSALAPPEETRQRLESKLKSIHAEIHHRIQNGDPPHDAAEALQEFGPLMNQGNSEDAEMLLDHVMELLGISSTDNEAAAIDRQNGSNPPQQLGQVPVMPARTFAQVKQRVDSLHVQDVAWRKIDWEVCLLKGLQKSKAENKPVLLWVFIDRPVDDERC